MIRNFQKEIFVSADAPPRKRKRMVENHKSYIAKQRVERGAEHQTKTKTIAAKKFSAQDTCKCASGKKPKPSCPSKIGTERQQEIFAAYYEGMNWSQKNALHPCKCK